MHISFLLFDEQCELYRQNCQRCKHTLHENPHIFSQFGRYASFLAILPIKFLSISKTVTLETKNKSTNNSKRRLFAVNLLFAVYIVQLFQTNNTTPIEHFMACFCLFIFLACVPHCNEQYKKQSEICYLTEAIFQFDLMYPVVGTTKHISLRTKCSTVAIYCLMTTAVGFPLEFSHGLHWMNPCWPTMVGYWLIPECHDIFTKGSFLNTGIKIFTKCSVIQLNHWFWSIVSLFFNVAVLHTMSVASLHLHQFIQRWQIFL